MSWDAALQTLVQNLDVIALITAIFSGYATYANFEMAKGSNSLIQDLVSTIKSHMNDTQRIVKTNNSQFREMLDLTNERFKQTQEQVDYLIRNSGTTSGEERKKER